MCLAAGRHQNGFEANPAVFGESGQKNFDRETHEISKLKAKK
jgi:hypothetical protein